MATKETDTDPSTPGSRVPKPVAAGAPIMPGKIVPVGSPPPPGAFPAPPRGTPSTDPGVAPPVPLRPRHEADTDPDPRPPLPPPRPKPGTGPNDSVDALLEGIAGPQPDKTKKTPQSHGEAAAAYQVEHKVLPAQPTPPPEASVIVQRQPQPPTLRLDRSKIQAAQAAHVAAHAAAAPESADDVTGAMRGMRGGEATVVTPRAQGPRIVIALLAAVLVVFAIFMAMRMWAVGVKRDAMATDPTASSFIKQPPPLGAGASVTATAPPTTLVTPTPTATTDTTATATATTTDPPKAATSGKPSTPKGGASGFRQTF